ncbi:hypothetical protein AVEN_79705-1, partial [Araneus ventricosus]
QIPGIGHLLTRSETASPTEDSVRTLDEKLPVVIEPPESMLREECEEWMSIDEDNPVAATLIDLEIFQADCK